MQSTNEAAAAFLASKRVAVTGVSRTPKTHGSNNVYRRRHRLGRRHRLRPGPQHHCHRRRLPPDVRAHRRLRAQDHAPGECRARAQAGVRQEGRERCDPEKGDVMTEARLLDRVTASDRDGCPDVEVFAQGVRTALDELAERRLRPPREGTA